KDVVSESILIAFEQLDELKDEAAFLSYLFSIASNLVNKKIRRKKFWGWFDGIAAENRADNSNSEHTLMQHELNRALNKIPQKQREAIVWYEISGLSMEEIAKLQNLSVAGVKTNIHRARKTLSQLLENKEEKHLTQMKGVWYE
ncbi:MAG: RNA polymerase sigma factor, partial [Bacteroidia bacterium]